ncbi:MAG: SPFH domain-containing protein [Geminicoccaceae bacterium]|nr:MAG: SPFH domain-containing protein [Geminicoccaceae bacterium]
MIWNRLFGEFVDVIEWLDDSPNTLVYRFPRPGNEIKYGAKLTVREGQMAVFIHEGEMADVFAPGMYELQTQNLPILSTLQNWPHGFQSPFKSEIYFCNMRRFTDLKWGTKNPIILRDPEFGPIRVRAFGTYVMRIQDPALFLREIVGTDGRFTTEEISNQIRNIIVARFADVIAKSGIPILDLAGNYRQLSDFVTAKIAPEIQVYGLELTKLLVENVSVPSEVERALDQRSAAGIVGDLQRYMTFQTAQALGQPGGAAATGVGLGAGIAMAQEAAKAVTSAPAPPPLPNAAAFHVAEGGTAAGPFAMPELEARARDGRLTRATLVWRDGMAGWQAAGEVLELRRLFPPAPPPLPPTGG